MPEYYLIILKLNPKDHASYQEKKITLIQSEQHTTDTEM